MGDGAQALWKLRLAAYHGVENWLDTLIKLERLHADAPMWDDSSILWPLDHGVRDLMPDDAVHIQKRLRELAAAGARVRIFDSRYRVLLLDGKPSSVHVHPLKDVAMGTYPNDVLAMDGMGVRIEFDLAERPEAMPDPGCIAVDALTLLSDETDVWEATGPRHRVRFALIDSHTVPQYTEGKKWKGA